MGGSKPLNVDVRIITATNRDLELEISKGNFREDLYYRINVVPIVLPPLRKRKEDIPILIDHFLVKYNKENSTKVKLSQEVMEYILKYDWPGNVRELENCVERMVIMSDNNLATREELPYEIIRAYKLASKPAPAYKAPSEPPAKNPEDKSLTKSIEVMEVEQILNALKKCGWVKSRAAKLIGITTRQLDYRISKYGISVEKPWQDS